MGTNTEIETALARLNEGQEALLAAAEAQGEALRVIAERLVLVLEKLTPVAGDGPTLQEIMAEMVKRIGENGTLLRRIDRRTESMAEGLPAEVAQAIAAGGTGAHPV